MPFLKLSASLLAAGLLVSGCDLDWDEILSDDFPQTSACPNFKGTPSYGDVDFSAALSPEPYRIEIAAGGKIDASDCISRTSGYVSESPDLDLYLRGRASRLYFNVEAESDTTLLINTPEGEWLYDDDSGPGLNPEIVVRNPEPGIYSVWVGARFESSQYEESTLTIRSE